MFVPTWLIILAVLWIVGLLYSLARKGQDIDWEDRLQELEASISESVEKAVQYEFERLRYDHEEAQ